MGILMPSFALAAENNDKFCFDKAVADKMATEIDYCNKMRVYGKEVKTSIKTENVNLFALSEVYKTKVSLLEEDKVLLRERGDKFETNYNKCVTDLNDTIEKQPSRLVWFGGGVVVTLILGIVAAFAIK